MNLNRESAVRALGELYESWGYARFRMSKFEEYGLYAANRDFLVSDSVITFTDTDGKLMALKPDVTLSIIKNAADGSTTKKLFYDENVYRVTKEAMGFREIRQVGLECVGKVDEFCLEEVLLLACRSLEKVSESSVLDVSHLGILSDLLEGSGLATEAKKRVIKCVGEKNAHEIGYICRDGGADPGYARLLGEIAGFSDRADAVIKELERFPEGAFRPESLALLKRLCRVLESQGAKDQLRLDFSVINDMNYYNGIVFKGFAEGIPSGVLSGGQYDRLTQRMGKKAGAVGFAVYTDLLRQTDEGGGGVDELLLYDGSVDPATLFGTAEKLRGEGKKVLTASAIPSGIRYKKLTDLRGGNTK